MINYCSPQDTTTKRQILKASMGLKDIEVYLHVNINEDLPTTSNSKVYKARLISQTWTIDGQIFASIHVAELSQRLQIMH